MTPEETEQLVALLTKLQSKDLAPPNMPQEAWMALHKIVPLPTVEVLVTTTGKDFLLVERHDEYWDGWHIPGGYILHKESIPDACSRVGKRELGVEVEFKKLIDAFTWPDHPYGSPVSLVCVCHASAQPKEGSFFTEVPKDMIAHQDAFIGTFLSVG